MHYEFQDNLTATEIKFTPTGHWYNRTDDDPYATEEDFANDVWVSDNKYRCDGYISSDTDLSWIVLRFTGDDRFQLSRHPDGYPLGIVSENALKVWTILSMARKRHQ